MKWLNSIYRAVTSARIGLHDLAKKMLESENLPESMFIASDSIAIGVFTGDSWARLRIPEDIADQLNDIPTAKFTFPSFYQRSLSILNWWEFSVNLLIEKAPRRTKTIPPSLCP